MKTAIIAASLLTALALPTLASAQQAVSRPQVHAQLINAERAGFNANNDPKAYPENIQGVAQRAGEMRGVATAGSAGASTSGSFASGRAANAFAPSPTSQRDPNGYNRP